MATNNIETIQAYALQLLDKEYKAASKTAVLDGNVTSSTFDLKAGMVQIPKISLTGLGAYDKDNGYKKGGADYTFEPKKFDYDRGVMFSIDAVDDMDTLGQLLGNLSNELVRTKVVPEIDAYRMATYAAAGASVTEGTEYADGEAVRKAIADKWDAMTDAEVPEEGRYLFILPGLYGMLRDMDTTKSKDLISRFAGIQTMPQSRFYTAITLLDEDGYEKAEGAYDLNFLIVTKSATIQLDKRVVPKLITPEQNQDADAYKFGYRNVGIADVFDNKTAGIAGEYAAAAATE